MAGEPAFVIAACVLGCSYAATPRLSRRLCEGNKADEYFSVCACVRYSPAVLLSQVARKRLNSRASNTLPTSTSFLTARPRLAYRVLYSFETKPENGGVPRSAGLLDVGGTFYGTTWGNGGKYGDGTVFSITTSGTEKVLHSFGEGTDGSNSYPQT